jgi:hypothetical protein
MVEQKIEGGIISGTKFLETISVDQYNDMDSIILLLHTGISLHLITPHAIFKNRYLHCT